MTVDELEVSVTPFSITEQTALKVEYSFESPCRSSEDGKAYILKGGYPPSDTVRQVSPPIVDKKGFSEFGSEIAFDPRTEDTMFVAAFSPQGGEDPAFVHKVTMKPTSANERTYPFALLA